MKKRGTRLLRAAAHPMSTISSYTLPTSLCVLSHASPAGHPPQNAAGGHMPRKAGVILFPGVHGIATVPPSSIGRLERLIVGSDDAQQAEAVYQAFSSNPHALSVLRQFTAELLDRSEAVQR